MTREYRFKSEIGTLYLVAEANTLRGVYWKQQTEHPQSTVSGRDTTSLLLLRAARQLNEYFSGRRQEFDVPTKFLGTPFQVRVWKELRKIPYGKTISYRELARRVRSPAAFRAVGSANGKNPLSILVPCHRVIAADGTLGGYAGGLSMKKKLLHLERVSTG